MMPHGDPIGQESDLWTKRDEFGEFGEFGEFLRMMRFVVLPTAVGMAVILTGWALSHPSGGHAVAFLVGGRDLGDHGSEWSGFFTFLGSEALLAAVGVLLFAVGLAHAWRRRRRGDTPSASTRTDIGTAVLVIVVVLDGLFALHHRVLPGVGVPAIVGTICYLLVLGLLVACARRPMHDAGIQLAFRVAMSCLAVAAVVVALAAHLEGTQDPVGVLANAGGFVTYLGDAGLCWVLVVRARRINGQVLRLPTTPTPAWAGAPVPFEDLRTESFALPAGDLWEDRGEFRQLGRTILRAAVPAGIVMAVFLAAFAATHHAIEIALQDQDTGPGASQWSGLFTFLGCSALVVSAGVLLGALDLARAWFGRLGPGQDRRTVRAGVGVAILVLLIAYDDLFMIHDSILPSFHVPEVVGNGFYVVVGGAMVLWVMLPVHRLGLLLSMLLGLGGLAVSVGGDKLEDVFEVSDPTLSHLLGNAEDISKFVGYAALCYVLVVFARSIVNQLLRLPTAPDASEAATAAIPIPATAE